GGHASAVRAATRPAPTTPVRTGSPVPALTPATIGGVESSATPDVPGLDAPSASAGDDGWRRLAPAARTTRAIASAIAGSVLAIPAALVLITILGRGIFVALLALPTLVLLGATFGA